MQLAAALSTAVPRGAPRVTHAAAGGSSCKPCAQELKMRDGDHEAPLEATDLTLRAGADGATMRVHAGLLAFNSRVLGDAMRATGGVPPKEGVLTLPGKRAEQLQLLVAWLYRCEDLSQDNIASLCCLAREYDIAAMLTTADTWLATVFKLPVPPSRHTSSPGERMETARQVARMMSLAKEHALPRFQAVVQAYVMRLNNIYDTQLMLRTVLMHEE